MSNPFKAHLPLKRVAICVAVISMGIVSMKALAALKEPPHAIKPEEPTLTVEVVHAEPRDIQTTLTGYGEATSVRSVAISPEVSGKVVEIHPNLVEGGIVPKGDLLFRLDTHSLLLEKKSAETRLSALCRNRDLLKKEFLRTRRLFEAAKTGSLASVERAEQNYNAAKESVSQLEQKLALTNLSLSRSVVKAPFTARIKSVNVKKEQYLPAGSPALTLADDSLLEVAVPLRGEEAALLLEFEGTPAPGAWFAPLKKKPCQVSWSSGHALAQGTLDRIIRYDAATRTVYVAVRITPQDLSGFPITDGMFCLVTIPGRILKKVIALPSHAIDRNGKVNIAEKGFLKRIPVETAYTRGETTCISAGIAPGTQVIVSRIMAPLENARLTLVQASKKTDGGSKS